MEIITINERIRRLRTVLEKSQKDFGASIGIKPNSVSDIETGKNNVTEQNIKAICLEIWNGKKVNEQWLRTGEGGDDNMFLKPQKNDLVARAALLLGQRDPMFEALVETYSKLDPVNREVLLNFGLDFIKNLKLFSEDK